eukprot:62073_1
MMSDSHEMFFIVISAIIGCIGIGLYFLLRGYYQYVQDKKFESLVNYFKTHRKFINIDDTNDRIRVMSYNILSPDPSGVDKTGDKYAMSDQHNYCPRKYRIFEYRLPRIMAQIVAYVPDIVCIQETSIHSFNNYIFNEFTKLNYNSWHEIRDKQNNLHTQSIFWNKNKFNFINKKVIRLNTIFDEKYFGPKDKNNAFLNMFKQCPDILQVLHLSTVSNKKEFIICSSHFFWDPNWSDVKLLQCMILNIRLYTLLM